MDRKLNGKSWMNAIAFALLLALLGLHFGAMQLLRAGSSEDSEAFWRSQIRKVRLGMRQERVLEFLPNRSEETQKYDNELEGYTLSYALDKHWSVATGFDRSGWHEKNNPYLIMGFPNDKVIRRPRLVRQENSIDEKHFPAIPPKFR